MGTPDPRRILRVPGDIYWNGSAIGLVRNIEVRWDVAAEFLTMEEFGGTLREVIYTGESVVIAAVLRSWDSAALGAIFPNASGGGISVTVTSGTKPGTILTPGALTFTPKDSNHPSVTFPAAVGLPKLAATLSLRLDEEIGIGAVWYATPDSSGNLYTIS